MTIFPIAMQLLIYDVVAEALRQCVGTHHRLKWYNAMPSSVLAELQRTIQGMTPPNASILGYDHPAILEAQRWYLGLILHHLRLGRK